MIKYSINCKKCNNIFDSWFASSKEFERLKKLKLINCPHCNSLEIQKAIMSPSVAIKIRKKKESQSSKFKEVKSKIKEFQKYIKKNFEYVGENFSYEARSIYYGSKKSKKGIYGTASKEDINELKTEGIQTVPIPWINDNDKEN